MNIDNHPHPNELISVMVYTQSSIFWGELKSSGNVLPGRVLVGNNLPIYLTIQNGKSMGALSAQFNKLNTKNQLHIPVAQIIAFHIMPPQQGLLDYDESDPARNFKYFTTAIGEFELKGAFRLPKKSNVKWAIESSKSDFISCYKIKVTHSKRNNTNPLEPKIAYLRRDALIIAED